MTLPVAVPDGRAGTTRLRAATTVEDDTGTPAPVQPMMPILEEAEDIDPAADVVHVQLTAAPATHTITDWRTARR